LASWGVEQLSLQRREAEILRLGNNLGAAKEQSELVERKLQQAEEARKSAQAELGTTVPDQMMRPRVRCDMV